MCSSTVRQGVQLLPAQTKAQLIQPMWEGPLVLPQPVLSLGTVAHTSAAGNCSGKTRSLFAPKSLSNEVKKDVAWVRLRAVKMASKMRGT